MPGHRGSKDGVASLAYVPGIPINGARHIGMAETSPAMTAVEMNETARALASCLNSTLSALYERILAQDSSRPDDGYDATECAFRSTTIQARHP
jgi:hypothetical protein